MLVQSRETRAGRVMLPLMDDRRVTIYGKDT